jgi:hypothetical protein
MAKNSFWTPEEDMRLKKLIEAGGPIELVAEKLRRSVSAIKGRAQLLKISRKKITVKTRDTH